MLPDSSVAVLPAPLPLSVVRTSACEVPPVLPPVPHPDESIAGNMAAVNRRTAINVDKAGLLPLRLPALASLTVSVYELLV
jgi:hypothetical protein